VSNNYHSLIIQAFACFLSVFKFFPLKNSTRIIISYTYFPDRRHETFTKCSSFVSLAIRWWDYIGVFWTVLSLLQNGFGYYVCLYNIFNTFTIEEKTWLLCLYKKTDIHCNIQSTSFFKKKIRIILSQVIIIGIKLDLKVDLL
jgi:hypothetical protein